MINCSAPVLLDSGADVQISSYPTTNVATEVRRHINICREVYNTALRLYNSAPDGDKPTYIQLQKYHDTHAVSLSSVRATAVILHWIRLREP